jgi:hypothetical protein
MPLAAGLLAGTVSLAATAAASSVHKPAPKEPTCSVSNSGGVPSSGAVGGWSYSVSFSCPFALKSFSFQTNKHLLSGVDKFGTTVPYAYAQLKTGKQANFTCKDTATRAVTCTASPELPARVDIVDQFDSSTPCFNTKKSDQLRATLVVNGKATRASFVIGKSTSGTIVGGCG